MPCGRWPPPPPPRRRRMAAWRARGGCEAAGASRQRSRATQRCAVACVAKGVRPATRAQRGARVAQRAQRAASNSARDAPPCAPGGGPGRAPPPARLASVDTCPGAAPRDILRSGRTTEEDAPLMAGLQRTAHPNPTKARCHDRARAAPSSVRYGAEGAPTRLQRRNRHLAASRAASRAATRWLAPRVAGPQVALHRTLTSTHAHAHGVRREW